MAGKLAPREAMQVGVERREEVLRRGVIPLPTVTRTLGGAGFHD
jgi:hypothetical protein